MTTSWWNRLKSGLHKSSANVGMRLKSVLFNRKIDEKTLDDIEDVLIQSDMGVTVAADIRGYLASLKLPPETAAQDLISQLKHVIVERLTLYAKPLDLNPSPLAVVMMVGVNGAGKTTTIAKLAKQWSQKGLNIEVAACDTFRAAATEQLVVWAKRLNIKVYTGHVEQDPSGLVFDSLQKALANKADVLIIDTAGRLHNKEHLMNELQKMQRVARKVIPDAPHHVLLVLDATTGQNALNQAQAFIKSAAVSGMIVTKLDGTAKGGVILALTQEFKLPIYAIGVGESYDDLQSFTAEEFADALLEGIES